MGWFKNFDISEYQDIEGEILIKISAWDLQITSTYPFYSRYQCSTVIRKNLDLMMFDMKQQAMSLLTNLGGCARYISAREIDF